MKKFALVFSLSALSLLFMTPSCRKYGGPVPHPHHYDTLCQVTQLRVEGLYGLQRYGISYNAHGNPISMVVDSINPNATSALNFYYRYDSSKRLSEQIVAGLLSSGASIWHKYVYAQPDFIIDTVLRFNVEDPSSLPGTNGPTPSSPQAYYYTIAGYTLDTYGRVVKVWSIPNDPSQPSTVVRTWSYDASGDRVLSNPGYAYDDKVNPYLTNTVWQFLNLDYSIHNVIRTDSSYTNVYNEYGLPVDLQNLLDFTEPVILFGVNNLGLGIRISYSCD